MHTNSKKHAEPQHDAKLPVMSSKLGHNVEALAKAGNSSTTAEPSTKV